MLEIFNPKALEGKSFKDSKGQQLICIGVGQNPDGSCFVVGASFDATKNETFIATEIFRKANFDGDITAALTNPNHGLPTVHINP